MADHLGEKQDETGHPTSLLLCLYRGQNNVMLVDLSEYTHVANLKNMVTFLKSIASN